MLSSESSSQLSDPATKTICQWFSYVAKLQGPLNVWTFHEKVELLFEVAVRIFSHWYKSLTLSWYWSYCRSSISDFAYEFKRSRSFKKMVIELEVLLMSEYLIILISVPQWLVTTCMHHIDHWQVAANTLNQLSLTLLACTRIKATGHLPRIVRQYGTLIAHCNSIAMVLQITEADIGLG